MGDMLFELITAPPGLSAEGYSEADVVGKFSGPVLAIGLRSSDPVAGAASAEAEHDEASEGLLGWGATYFLVADTSKPAPVWVAKSDVASHSLSALPTTGVGDPERRDPVRAGI